MFLSSLDPQSTLHYPITQDSKMTIPDALVQALNDQHNYRTVKISLDGLYLDRDELVQLRINSAWFWIKREIVKMAVL